MGGQASSFQIFDYRFVDSHNFFEDPELWKLAVEKKTKDMVVLEQHTYKTPLVALGPVGSCVENVRLGPNQGLFHKFFVLKLQSKVKDEEEKFVCFEKQKDGIVFQIAADLDAVKDHRCGNRRKGNVTEFNSRLNTIEGLLTRNLAPIEVLLNNFKMLDVTYKPLSSNCESHVQAETLLDASTSVQLKIPGLKEKVPINSEKLLPHIEAVYPSWIRNEVTEIPIVEQAFASLAMDRIRADGDGAEAIEIQYVFLAQKQKFYLALCDMLKHSSFNGRRKAILTNLTGSNFEKALGQSTLDGKAMPPAIAKAISTVWQRIVELFSQLEDVGIILTHFVDADAKDQTEGQVLTMDERASILSEIHQPPTGIKCIHTLTVCFNSPEVKMSNPEKRTIGYHTILKLDAKIISEPDKLQNQLFTFISALGAKMAKKDKKRMNQYLEKLTAEVIALQNLESQEMLIHENPMSPQREGRR